MDDAYVVVYSGDGMEELSYVERAVLWAAIEDYRQSAEKNARSLTRADVDSFFAKRDALLAMLGYGGGIMTEPGVDLEYCVRDHSGNIVVPWQPVGELRDTLDDWGERIRRTEHAYARETHVIGSLMADHPELVEAELAAFHRWRVLLGLEPAPETDR